MANFVSNDNVTSLMNAINQKKDSKPGTITWAEWIALTDEQREGTHYIITNVPAKFSDKDAVFSIKDQTLTFTNKTATVTDSRITADTYIFTFYHNQAVAQAAGIECSWTIGTVTFTVVDTPASDIVVDILCILPALATPPSEGGGHKILDADGSEMAQEDSLQFADSFVSDDDVNGKTVVENIKEHSTKADYDNATEDGFHVIDDGEDAVIHPSSEDYVEVTADGVKTRGVLLNELFVLIDSSKITDSSMLDIGGAIFQISIITNSEYRFGALGVDSNSNTFLTTAIVNASNSKCERITIDSNASAQYRDLTANKPSNGTKITLYYGNKKAVVDLQTTANRCLMSDGVTSVEQALTYSTNEHVVGKWIDGSDLYEKTVDIGNLPNATNKSVAHGITNLDKVISIEGFARGGSTRVPIPYVATVSTNNVAVYVNGTSIIITAGNDSSAYSGYVTIRYTKV